MSEVKCGTGQCSESSGKWSEFDYSEAERFPGLVALMKKDDAGAWLGEGQAAFLKVFRARQDIARDLATRLAERKDQVAPTEREWIVKFKLIAGATIHKTVAKGCLDSVFTDKDCPVKAADYDVVGYRIGKVKHISNGEQDFTLVNLFIKVVAASVTAADEKASPYVFGRLEDTDVDHPYSHGRVAKVLDC